MPPRTHDLELLGKELGVSDPIGVDLETLASSFDVARYPDDAGVPSEDAISEDVAGKHTAAAERVLEWVAKEL